MVCASARSKVGFIGAWKHAGIMLLYIKSSNPVKPSLPPTTYNTVNQHAEDIRQVLLPSPDITPALLILQSIWGGGFQDYILTDGE